MSVVVLAYNTETRVHIERRNVILRNLVTVICKAGKISECILTSASKRTLFSSPGNWPINSCQSKPQLTNQLLLTAACMPHVLIRAYYNAMQSNKLSGHCTCFIIHTCWLCQIFSSSVHDIHYQLLSFYRILISEHLARCTSLFE